VAVIDDGAPRGPAARAPGPADLAESGRGLRVVTDLAATWGQQEPGLTGLPGRAVWFQLAWPPDPAPDAAAGHPRPVR
jgi:hypothetical protein